MNEAVMTPTAEQAQALELFRTGLSLAIEAGAGAGKTSTLALLARHAHATGRRGQFVAFNKAIVKDAGAKMPSTVKCNTAHSLAFRAVGKTYAHRLESGRMKSNDIAARLGIDPLVVTVQDGQVKRLSAAKLAGITMKAVTRFCQSADLEPSGDHVPYIKGIDIPPGRMENNQRVREALEPAIRRAWKDLMDIGGSLPYTHDHYLKAWHLQGARIAADYILFDEAQDANPVLAAIVAAQKHAQLVWVGDSQQAIYGFTGAVNALETVCRRGAAIIPHAELQVRARCRGSREPCPHADLIYAADCAEDANEDVLATENELTILHSFLDDVEQWAAYEGPEYLQVLCGMARSSLAGKEA